MNRVLRVANNGCPLRDHDSYLNKGISMQSNVLEQAPSSAKLFRNAFAKRGDDLRKRSRLGETAIHTLLFICGAVSVLTTVGIIYVLEINLLSGCTTYMAMFLPVLTHVLCLVLFKYRRVIL